MARMIAFALGVALSAPACAARSSQPARPRHIVKVYTFGAELADDSKVCVETPWLPPDPCITLGRLRRMARETGAN